MAFLYDLAHSFMTNVKQDKIRCSTMQNSGRKSGDLTTIILVTKEKKLVALATV